MSHPVGSPEEIRSLTAQEAMKSLDSSERGLSTQEVLRRQTRYGYNEIPEKRVHPIIKFLTYFWGPIPWLIEVALVLSAIMGRTEDFVIIFVLLLFNAGVGFWQEHKADRAIELLKQRLSPVARVLRDGAWKRIAARELVPGDVVRVRLGDILPADIKIVGSGYLVMDESALTGESLPVTRNPGELGYSGSIVRQGETEGLVYAIGQDTYIGRTTRLMAETIRGSHFQKAVIRIGDYLIALALGLAVVIFVAALIRHQSVLETLQFILVLTIAAIPAALPAVLTTTMAIGAMALARDGAIVSRLVSIEELAGVDVLCADKTGTLTRNELTVAEILPFGGRRKEDVLVHASLASRAEDQDPIDDTILARIQQEPDTVQGALAACRVLSFQPFNPVDKRTEAEIEGKEGTRFRVTKGAPQVVLALASPEPALAGQVQNTVSDLAHRGYRALGVARTNSKGAWEFIGLLALFDPPRDDSAETLSTARSMGLSVKMLTGDHTAIATEIAQKLQLGTRITPASALENKSLEEIGALVENSDGFAEVFPEHKYRIVEALQERDHITGMTGDGVNDAPALKKADAGIAVAGATDAAKSAADIVLTRPGISVIIEAIQQSRKIFQRMNNYSIYRIAETVRVLFFISASILIFQFYPVTALMIVLLAILNDFPIITIAFDRVIYPDRPVRWQMNRLLELATILGVYGVFESFGLLYIGLSVLHLSPVMLQSFIYLKLSVAGHLILFVSRTRGPFWSVRPARPLFLAVILTQLTATLLVVYGILLPPIGWSLALLVWGYSLVTFLIADRVKLGTYALLDRRLAQALP